MSYDLKERTEKFGENSINFCHKIQHGPITNPLITQYIKCSTSIGANYCEADDAESRLDFNHKIGVCKKEASESMHFLKMLMVAVPNLTVETKVLHQEAKELHLIFNKIYRSTKKSPN